MLCVLIFLNFLCASGEGTNGLFRGASPAVGTAVEYVGRTRRSCAHRVGWSLV